MRSLPGDDRDNATYEEDDAGIHTIKIHCDPLMIHRRKHPGSTHVYFLEGLPIWCEFPANII